MFMPVNREKQKKLISFSSAMTENELDQRILTEISVFAGSLYFNTKFEQENFLDFISYCPKPRKQYQDILFEENKIEPNGYVLPQNRLEVFGKEKEKENFSPFVKDPSKFIKELISIRNYQLVPKSAHHNMIFSCGLKPFE
jgi:hypothetical protein